MTKVEAETPAAPAPAPAPASALAPAPAQVPAVPNNDVAEEKAVAQLHDQEKPVNDCKALAVVDRKLSLSLRTQVYNFNCCYFRLFIL